MKILVLNAGSSSQKSCLYEIGGTIASQPPKPLWEAIVDWAHPTDRAEIKVKTATGAVLEESITTQSRAEITAHLLNTVWQGKTQVIESLAEIDRVGHRVVHGGQSFRESVRITDAVKQTIASLANLAPAHNPANLEGIESIEKILGDDVPQFAVFDTAFHRRLPDAAAIYPGIYDWVEQGIRRYGFHGISHQYCAQRAAQLLDRPLNDLKLIVCHLGNGCSLSAIREGHSIDTTMGFTPLDGLMMGSRSGAVDPGILLYLLRQGELTVDQLDYQLNKESGLKGISGLSSDMRQIQSAIAAGHVRAKLALEIYGHRLRAAIGSMLANLGGLDALIFTAGVGENSPQVRSIACEPLAFLGLKLDATQNQNYPIDQDIAASDSTVRILVIHTQEDWAIAQECYHQSLQ
ncbi:MAG: acetate kinase [Leptolyngbyaceae cyanobacterium CSU_1_3]|nr:acetate kinase [Leptolyngbyaceae cyanobacterium CSU_1_3]